MRVILLFLVNICYSLMDNLEDLMIIDSLLKNYDRRALPTNRMGRKETIETWRGKIFHLFFHSIFCCYKINYLFSNKRRKGCFVWLFVFYIWSFILFILNKTLSQHIDNKSIFKANSIQLCHIWGFKTFWSSKIFFQQSWYCYRKTHRG